MNIIERIATKQSNKGGTHDQIILCRIDNEYTPYVTWSFYAPTGFRGHGHYFETLEQAEKDFKVR